MQPAPAFKTFIVIQSILPLSDFDIIQVSHSVQLRQRLCLPFWLLAYDPQHEVLVWRPQVVVMTMFALNLCSQDAAHIGFPATVQ